MEERRFTLTRVSGTPVATDNLLTDLRRVAEIVGSVVSQRAYAEHGRYNVSTVERRFGTWSRAMEVAGLSAGNVLNYPDAVLFENIMRLWEHYGRQPRRVELAHPPSSISQSPYTRRFGSWTAALEQFVDYANEADTVLPSEAAHCVVRRGPRDPSLRLRFRVLKQDNFRCRACGTSPATSPGLHLHIDHIVPWSSGGETIESNLQTLCERCNLGKSDVL